MTATKYVTVWCDYEVAEGIHGCHFHIQTAEASIPEARRRARSEGWRRIGGKDACPACRGHIGSFAPGGPEDEPDRPAVTP